MLAVCARCRQACYAGSPGGTPEEMVEEESWPWPLEVMPATWIVYVVRAVRPVTR